MINADMRNYDYYTYDGKNEYAQPVLSTEIQGSVKMAIYSASQSIKDSIAYANTQYIGLTHADVTDKCVIQYGDKKLKVLYVNPHGIWKQVYMGEM